MKKSLLALSATTIVAILLVATSCLPTAASVVVTEDGNVVVTKDDLEKATATYSGRLSGKITVNNGDTFSVTLYTHLGAGMSWSVDIEDMAVVTSEGQDYLPDEPWPYIGGPGKLLWTFKALDTGTTTVIMTYSSVANLPDAPQNVNTLKLVVVVDGG